MAETISREKIKNAPYNPRSIDKFARAKLKKSLQKVGLVETLVWNARTGNLVGGHQRLSIIDDLEGSPNYMLTVARIDVDDKREKEINVSLNNTGIQGAFDEQKLEELMRGIPEVDRDVIGFDNVELKMLLGEQVFGGIDHQANTTEETVLGKIAQAKRKSREKEATDNSADHYLVIVFGTNEQMTRFTEHFRLPSEQFVDGVVIAEQLGVNL